MIIGVFLHMVTGSKTRNEPLDAARTVEGNGPRYGFYRHSKQGRSRSRRAGRNHVKPQRFKGRVAGQFSHETRTFSTFRSDVIVGCKVLHIYLTLRGLTMYRSVTLTMIYDHKALSHREMRECDGENQDFAFGTSFALYRATGTRLLKKSLVVLLPEMGSGTSRSNRHVLESMPV